MHKKLKKKRWRRTGGGKKKGGLNNQCPSLAKLTSCCANGRLIALLFNEDTRWSSQPRDVWSSWCSILSEKRATKPPKVFNLHAKSLGWKKERREKDTGVELNKLVPWLFSWRINLIDYFLVLSSSTVALLQWQPLITFMSQHSLWPQY